MKNLTKFSVIVLFLFVLTSCSEEIVQIDDGLVQSALKSEIIPDPEPIPECLEETAWGDGDLYVMKGSWATYTQTQLGACVPLYAGQDMYAGKVCFWYANHPDSIKVKVYLSRCWSLQDVEEPIKIQGYDTPPTEKPSPGQFEYKEYQWSESNHYYYMIVKKQNFFGVHVDVQNCCE